MSESDSLRATVLRLAAAGHSKHEIAAVTGLSRGNVAGILYRARRTTIATAAGKAPAKPIWAGSFRPGRCCFPLWGDEKPTHKFCGKPVMEPGAPYCALHYKKTHRVVGAGEPLSL